MINKKNLWFLTLFSLVLVLSVYYVTMPSELMVTNNSVITNNKDAIKSTTNSSTDKTSNSQDEEATVNISQSDTISTLKMEDNDDAKEEIAKVKEKLTNTESTVSEKNSAFEELKVINQKAAKEDLVEEKIKTELKLESFVKIDGDQIRVVIGKAEHTPALANEIMRLVQSLYDSKMYISVKFEG